jgi:hypothetical protein
MRNGQRLPQLTVQALQITDSSLTPVATAAATGLERKGNDIELANSAALPTADEAFIKPLRDRLQVDFNSLLFFIIFSNPVGYIETILLLFLFYKLDSTQRAA